MKTKFLLALSIALFIAPNLLTKAEAQSDSSLGDIQFACGQSFDHNSQQYISTTFAWNNLNKKPIVTWNKETCNDAGFDPQKRCEAVSPRFQEAYANQSP